MFPSLVTPSSHGHTDDYPWIVVAEDAGVLFVSFRIRRYLTHFDMIDSVCRIVEHDAVFAVHHLLHGVDSLIHHSLFESDAGHRTPSLALDEYLSLFVLFRADFVAVEVVCSQIPVAVPSVFLHGFHHGVDSCFHAFSLIVEVVDAIFCGVVALLIQLTA